MNDISARAAASTLALEATLEVIANQTPNAGPYYTRGIECAVDPVSPCHRPKGCVNEAGCAAKQCCLYALAMEIKALHTPGPAPDYDDE